MAHHGGAGSAVAPHAGWGRAVHLPGQRTGAPPPAPAPGGVLRLRPLRGVDASRRGHAGPARPGPSLRPAVGPGAHGNRRRPRHGGRLRGPARPQGAQRPGAGDRVDAPRGPRVAVGAAGPRRHRAAHAGAAQRPAVRAGAGGAPGGGYRGVRDHALHQVHPLALPRAGNLQGQPGPEEPLVRDLAGTSSLELELEGVLAMTERPVGWAFVGTSGWVDSRFAPSVAAAGHKLVGAFGSSAEGSARFAHHYQCTPYDSLEQLLADDAVEAVWVASPTALHPDHARAAAKAGRAVLVEKPLSVEVAAARLLAEALASGQIGTLSSLTLHQGYAGPPKPSAWRTDPAQSGGWAIGDIGTHLLDLARYLLGEVDVHAARLSSPGRSLVVDDLCWIMLAHGEATVVLRAAFCAVVRGAPWTGSSIQDGVRVAELTSAARESSSQG